MARRPAATDALIALGLGVEMQVELLFVHAPRRDLVLARIAALALAGALAARRREPVLAAALALGGITLLESRGDAVSGSLAGPFFTLLFVSYSIGAHADGRRLAAASAVLLGARSSPSASTSRPAASTTGSSR
jgi:hypothetical protein